MKTELPIEIDYCLVTAKPMSFLEYQAIYQYINEKKFLRAINILQDGKLIKKFRLEVMLPFDERLNETSIITKLLFRDIVIESPTSNKNSNKRNNRKKTKVNKNARTKAASNLFTSLGL
ncbi:MAG: hypothetical protein PHC38_10450 [Weeksellaceae bacterium]|jgi:hypothetical protein|nr:hypothetical protein [Weeksellaceae bacterium]